MENVYLFLFGKEFLPKTTGWAKDRSSLAVDFGGWRICPCTSLLLTPASTEQKCGYPAPCARCPVCALLCLSVPFPWHCFHGWMSLHWTSGGIWSCKAMAEVFFFLGGGLNQAILFCPGMLTWSFGAEVWSYPGEGTSPTARTAPRAVLSDFLQTV